MINRDQASCPDIGDWRAWLDRETVSSELDGHVDDCPACRRLVADLRADAADVGTILSSLAPSRLPTADELLLARQRLAWRRAGARSKEPVLRFATRLSTRTRVVASGLAAILVVSLLVAFTPQGGSVAAAFLSQFRSQQVTAIELTPQTQSDIVRTLAALGNLGRIQGPGLSGQPRPEAAARAAEGQTRSVSLAEAAQTMGFPLLTPDPTALPAGISGTPRVRVMPASQIRFTFDKKKAQAYLQSTGHADVALPDKFDGASIVVSIPAAAALEYGNPQNRSGLVVAEAGEVVADVQGNVSLPEMRDFLLSLPGLPAGIVNQLKQIQNWNDTLPIPVPIDQVHWQATTINGNRGLVLNDNSGVGSAAIWHANGHLFGVAGSLKAVDLLRVADTLAVR